MAQLFNEELKPEDLPPDFSTLHPSIQLGLLVYEDLPNTYTGGNVSIFAGKDLGCFKLVCELNYIESLSEMKEVFRVVKHLERKDVKDSRDKAKAEIDKASKKK